MDDADMADDRIMNMINDGIERARRETERSLKPIIQSIDGHRYGICHWCNSSISPGHLFCQADIEEPANSCAAMAEHERKRNKALGL